MEKYFVYILRTDRNTLYTGKTNDIARRLKEHREKKGKGAKYTRSFKSVELVYLEDCVSLSEALKREIEIKKMTKTKKEDMILRYSGNFGVSE